MIVAVCFEEMVTTTVHLRLTPAEVDAAYEAGGVTEESPERDRRAAIEEWLRANGELEPRWFEKLEDQHPSWVCGESGNVELLGDVTIEVAARELLCTTPIEEKSR